MMTRDPRAQSAVEALLGTILFVTLIFGGLELARAVSLKQALDRGAFEGARYLATHGNVAGTTPVVQAAVGRAILGADPAQASVSTTWTPATSYGDSVCVTAHVCDNHRHAAGGRGGAHLERHALHAVRGVSVRALAGCNAAMAWPTASWRPRS